MPGGDQQLPIVEVPAVNDPHVQNLVVLMARMEALAEERFPHVVRGRKRESEALGQRLSVPGEATIGTVDLLTGAHARGCETALLARRILKRCRSVISEEVERLHADRA